MVVIGVVEPSEVARPERRRDVAAERHAAAGQRDRLGRQDLRAGRRHTDQTRHEGDYTPNFHVRRQIIIRGVNGLSLAVMAIYPLLAADAADRVTRTVPLTPGVPIRIEATVADVTIVGSNRPDVLVEIVRHAPTSADFAKYPVVIEDRRDGLHVTVLQAPVRGEPGRDANLRTAIAIAAPATAVFQAVRVFEGRVTVTNLKTAVDVDLRRGPIEATALAGRVRLETGIGSIDVRTRR